MYLPPLSPENEHCSEWPARRDMLRNRIEMISADVVCLQEVSPESFEDDFSFMMELGYDGKEMFKRGRFRPATFWKTSKVELVHPPVHKDRTLLTAFMLKDEEHIDEERNWHVLNCHLQAGKQGSRRVRQIVDGVSACTKLAKKLKETDPTDPMLIVCGDFNGGDECGAIRYIEDGLIGPDFVEDGEAVTSRDKKITTCAPLVDAMILKHREAPPTLVVPELISLMVHDSTSATAYDNPILSKDIIERLKRIYDNFATYRDEGNKRVMCKTDVEQWLEIINKKVMFVFFKLHSACSKNVTFQCPISFSSNVAFAGWTR